MKAIFRTIKIFPHSLSLPYIYLHKIIDLYNSIEL